MNSKAGSFVTKHNNKLSHHSIKEISTPVIIIFKMANLGGVRPGVSITFLPNSREFSGA
jgi:hypothetical protein